MNAAAPEQNVNVTFMSSEFAVRDALCDVLAGLEPLSLTIEEAGTVELVLAEVLNNVVEHAYPNQTTGPIDINCTQKPDGLHICVADQGQPMPDGKTPLGMPARVDVDFLDLPEGGFGWFLIQDLAKDVIYCRVGAQNQLTLRLPVATLTV